jgi:hypothetical protein
MYPVLARCSAAVYLVGVYNELWGTLIFSDQYDIMPDTLMARHGDGA